MNWSDIGYIKASKNRIRVFQLLAKGEKTPKELQKDLGLHFSQISRALKELKEREIVECLNEDSRMGKIYALSEKGKEIKHPVLKLGE